MSYANDRVEAARRRSLDRTHNTDIEVYEPAESYSPGDGYAVSHPDPDSADPDATYRARAMAPQARSDTERSGTTSEIDRRFAVRDDSGQQWTEFGDSGEAATRIRETETGIVYAVKAVTDRHDGREMLDCVEV